MLFQILKVVTDKQNLKGEISANLTSYIANPRHTFAIFKVLLQIFYFKFSAII